MRFQPKSEEELQVYSLLEPGVYSFEVTDASNEKSKNGNDMIKLTIAVYDKNGSIHHMFDYLLEAMAYKLRHFCSYTGLIDKYQRGELSAMDCIGKKGSLEIVVQEGKLKDDGSRYPNRNSVKDYIERKNQSQNFNKDTVDDDVPF